MHTFLMFLWLVMYIDPPPGSASLEQPPSATRLRFHAHVRAPHQVDAGQSVIKPIVDPQRASMDHPTQYVVRPHLPYLRFTNCVVGSCAWFMTERVFMVRYGIVLCESGWPNVDRDSRINSTRAYWVVID
jgi:hypothetical protein